MQAYYDRYLAQTRQILALCQPQTWPELDRPALLARVREQTDRIRALRAGNDALLHRLVLDRDPAALTPRDVTDLLAFGDALLAFARHLDTGAAYALHRLLYRYAEQKGDEPLKVRELYNQGLSLYYLNLLRGEMGVNLFGEQISRYFTAAAACLDRFEELDDTTRDFAIRSLGNRRLADPAVWGANAHEPPQEPFGHYPAYKQLFDEAMSFVNSTKYRALAPALPWNRYAYAIHYARTAFLTALRHYPDPVMAQDVLASAEFVYQWQMLEKGDDTGRYLSADTRYRYAAARFHAGQISGDALIRQLLSLRNTVAADDYSANGIMVHVRLPQYTRQYLDLQDARVQQRYSAAVQAWQDSVDAYLRDAPAGEYADLIADLTGRILDSRLEAGVDLKAPMLDFLLWRHPPTYVHSHMVAFICRRLARRAADAAPGALACHAGTADADALAEKAARAGLYHDLGKGMLLQVVGLYTRSLLPEEYTLLECHPLMGWHMLRRFADLQDEAMAALYHHYWADGTHGYPHAIPPLPEDLRWLVDIVSVADSIDAATDDIGRCYATAKPFATLFDELRAGRGTRYAAWVVELLDDESFCAALEREVCAKREDLYYEVYSGAAEPKRV